MAKPRSASIRVRKHPKRRMPRKAHRVEERVRTATGRSYSLADYDRRLLPELQAERERIERDAALFRNNAAAGICRLQQLLRILECGLLEMPGETRAGNMTADDLAVLAQVAQEHAEGLMNGVYAGNVP